MRIKIDGSQIPLTVFAVENVGIEDWAPKKQYGTEEMKTSPDGKQLYSTRKSLVFLGDNGAENGITMTVTNPEPLEEMTKYELGGEVIFTPWVNNGRVAVSLIVEKLVKKQG
ncbi:hypothetical protein [Glutamicibacter ardleyensis]|uniref:hypothetical protein n=1 Tax=Glutamicibacter ardleyensis TaxID=225894 RepID=UPI003FD65104